MTEQYQFPYNKDSDTKKYLPIEVEGGEPIVLYSLNTDRTTKQIPDEVTLSYNHAYCHIANGNHWLLVKNSDVWKSQTNHFFMEQVDGKWKETDKKLAEKKVYEDAVSKGKGASAICLDGHPACEALIKHYHDQWISLDISIVSKDSEAMTTLLSSLDEGDPSEDAFAKVLSGNSKEMPIVHATPNDFRTNALKKPFPHVAYEEDSFTPLVVVQSLLPSLSKPRQSKSESQKAEEMLKAVTSYLKIEGYDALVEMAVERPVSVMVAFALHRSSLPLTMDVLKAEANAILAKELQKETTKED